MCAGGGDERTEACVGGESEESGLNCRVAARLRGRVRDLLTELSDIRALLRERVRASGRGLGTVRVEGAGEMEAAGGLGKLERLLGLDTDMVDEIVELVSRGAGGGGAGAALLALLARMRVPYLLAHLFLGHELLPLLALLFMLVASIAALARS